MESDPIDDELGRRAREIFRAVLGREPSERDEFLDQACRGNESLRAEVKSLLEYDRETDGIFEDRIFGDRAGSRRGEDGLGASRAGRKIGPYQLLRRLGSGGAGVVYLALRADDTFRKRVALKLLRTGLESAELVRRFRAERQILAALDHPNIAQLFDGGGTEDAPYLVMEYVEGLPITEYCDREGLSVEERIELFRTVCAAVHFAHQNLVVHRDLKPGNLLVTAEGVPKLLDFGIAKLLNPELSSSTLAPTATALRMMTPDYASPEQVRGEPISTASDVYSLGVLLYELLTGHQPYRSNSESPVEVMQLVCEQEPERPSLAALREHGTRRRPEAERRRRHRRLAGDLDNIVLMALRKEPRRRYASVEQLSEDLRRTLDGHPVQARKATWRYRSRKFVRRHRWAVAAVAALVVASLGFGIAMGVLQARIVRERDGAAEERQRAEKVTEFLTDLFEVSDPFEGGSANLTASQILEAGSRRLAVELADQPELRATLMDTVGVIYRKLGLFDDARPLLERALETRRRLFGEEHSRVAESLRHLAELEVSEGAYETAESLYRETLAMQRRLFGDEHSEIAETLTGLGWLLDLKGDYEPAEPLLGEALAMRRRLFGDRHLEVADSLEILGGLLTRGRSDFEAAEPLLREALALRRELLGAEHLDVAASLKQLAYLLFLQSEYAVAEPMYREVLEIRRRLLGDQHPLIATSLNDLANVVGYSYPGNLQAAERLYGQALEIQRRSSGEHPAMAKTLSNLGVTWYELGDYDKALEHLREALDIGRRHLGDSAAQVGIVRTWLAETLIAQGQPEAAHSQVQEALVILRSRFPEDHWWVLHAESTRAACLTAFGRFQEAERLLLGSYPKLKKKMGENDPLTRRALARIRHLYEAWGQPEKAAEYRALSPAPPPPAR